MEPRDTVSFEPRSPGASDRPRPDGSDVRAITAADVPRVAASLALAFYDDPHMRWVIRSDDKRLARLKGAFAIFIRGMWLEAGAAYTTVDLAGAAFWMRPEAWFVGPLRQLRMTPATVWTLRSDIVRLLRAFAFMERKHPREPSHWYLPLIGLAPEWQGRGYGQALLAPVLASCDQEGVPAYLEASTARNRALYERNGFEVMEECTYARDAPPLWRMWREPAR